MAFIWWAREEGHSDMNSLPTPVYSLLHINTLTSWLRLSSLMGRPLSLAQLIKYFFASSTRPWVRSHRADSGTHLEEKPEDLQPEASLAA